MRSAHQKLRFEDLLAWQSARKLVRAVYALTRSGQLASDFGLRSQIQRAAVSIMSNIAEGFDRVGPREFAKFLSIAQGSCGEVKSLSYVLLDLGYVEDYESSSLFRDAEEVARIIGGLTKSVRRRIPSKA